MITNLLGRKVARHPQHGQKTCWIDGYEFPIEDVIIGEIVAVSSDHIMVRHFKNCGIFLGGDVNASTEGQLASWPATLLRVVLE